MTHAAHPSRFQGLLFRFKARVLALRRSLQNLRDPVPLHGFGPPPEPGWPLLGESLSNLWDDRNPLEFHLVAGKVQNLRIAARHLDGLLVPAHETFSFWRQVGAPVRRRGFVEGRELREGCLVASPGGGLCQLSNALYDAALEAGFEILERHAHTQVISGSLAEKGRDATVFWNYVDLRFRSDHPFRITVRLEPHRLRVSFQGPRPSPELGLLEKPSLRRLATLSLGACDTCGIGDCAQHLDEATTLRHRPQSAFIVDAWWPEFEAYLRDLATPQDRLILPWPYRGSRHLWNQRLGLRTHGAAALALRRSLASRRLAAQGARRQAALLRWDERLAVRLAQQLKPEDRHLVVSQNLLPFLWRDGHLGGRTFDVLLQRHPLHRLQAHLDDAYERHPESQTLNDFRAPEQLLAWEQEALAMARRWVTPHVGFLAEPDARNHLVEWQTASATERQPSGLNVLFPASTLGRKGAHTLKAALMGMEGLTLHLGGPVLEAPDFWEGIATVPYEGNLGAMAVVVLPAFIEHQPRTLLRALASGIPVVTTPECGIPAQPGLHLVPKDDAAALRETLQQCLVSLVQA